MDAPSAARLRELRQHDEAARQSQVALLRSLSWDCEATDAPFVKVLALLVRQRRYFACAAADLLVPVDEGASAAAPAEVVEASQWCSFESVAAQGIWSLPLTVAVSRRSTPGFDRASQPEASSSEAEQSGSTCRRRPRTANVRPRRPDPADAGAARRARRAAAERERYKASKAREGMPVRAYVDRGGMTVTDLARYRRESRKRCRLAASRQRTKRWLTSGDSKRLQQNIT